MRKIWCFENLKTGENFLAGKHNFFFLIFQMEREREEIGGERRPSQPMVWGHITPWPWGAHGPHGGRGSSRPWGPRPHQRPAQVASRPGLSSHALPRFFNPYLGHPNSDFESVFGLETMTPSCTTMNTQLWKMVEKSSRKTSMKSTQRMRMKSSVATLFGLETTWMSNRNDRNSIRNHNRACSSPNTKIRKHTNTKTHTYASFRT